jgi:hypothetical protein
MYSPTPIYVEGKCYFKYYPFILNTKEVKKGKSHLACGEENADHSLRCSYCARIDRVKFDHPPQWVSTYSYPYSRLPTFHELKKKESNNIVEIYDSLLMKTILFFNKCNIADRAIENNEFREFCMEIYKFNRKSTDFETEFINFMKTKYIREKFSEKKKEIAHQKRVRLCKSIKNKIINLIIDSGTYGNRTRLLVKVARPLEKKTQLLWSKEMEENTPPVNHDYISDKSNSKLSKNKSILLNKDIQWASSCLHYMLPNGNKLLSDLSRTHSEMILNEFGKDEKIDLLSQDDNSPFLLNSYPNIRTAEDYTQAIIHAINIVEFFEGNVGSVTADQLPVQKKILSTSFLRQSILNQPMYDYTETDNEVKSEESGLMNFLSRTFSESNINVGNESDLPITDSSPFDMKTMKTKTLPSYMFVNNPLLEPENSPTNFITPKVERNISNNNEDITKNSANYIIPIYYICNCHLTHTSFRHAVKKINIGRKVLDYLKIIGTILQTNDMKSVLMGKMPLYYNTRWLAVYNACTFLIKKKNLIQTMLESNSLPLFKDISFFRKGIAPLIYFLMYNERDDVNVMNIFPLASQLILFLRLAQNSAEYLCAHFVPFFAELSYEIFKNFFMGEKGEHNMLAFSLTQHGRDGLRTGCKQWGTLPTDINSSKHFSSYEFFFLPEKLDYYSFGDLQKVVTSEELIKAVVNLEGTNKLDPRPYFNTIMDFYSNVNEKDSVIANTVSAKFQSSSSSNVIMFTPIETLQSFNRFPFNTISSKSDEINKSNSKSFVENKQKLFTIFTSTIEELPSISHVSSKSKKKKTDEEIKTSFDDVENVSELHKEINSIKSNKNLGKKFNKPKKKRKRKRNEKNYKELTGESTKDIIDKTIQSDVSSDTISAISTPKRSKRIIFQKKFDDFIYEMDFQDDSSSELEEEDKLTFLGKDEDGDSDNQTNYENEYENENESKMHKKNLNEDGLVNSKKKIVLPVQVLSNIFHLHFHPQLSVDTFCLIQVFSIYEMHILRKC